MRLSGQVSLTLAAGSLLLGPGCTGSLDRGGASYRGNEGPVVCGEPTGAELPMRRLSRVEYDYVIADLLGTTATPASSFPPDDSTIGFEVGITVSDRLARDYLDTGEALAADAVTDLSALDPILARCAGTDLPTGTSADACAAEFIASFGRRAYRRPLSTEEVTELTTLFRTGRELEDFRTGIQLVVNAMLISPSFLYRVEVAPPGASTGDVVSVVDYELASRLSFYFWRSMPDDELLDAAEAGELRTPEDVDAQARRMMEDPRFSRSYGDFFRQWLGLDRLAGLTKDDALYPTWSPELRDSLEASLDAFIDEIAETGSVDDMVRGGFAFVDERSAAHFGVTIPAGARPERDGLFRVALPEGERAGLFTHPALLAILGKSNQSDPIHRGVFIRTRVLCEVLDAPPADVDLTPPDLAPGLTTRERFDMHRNEPRCASCHTLIDPIGFGFENYDGIGRFRETEEGHVIDATGMVNAGGDANGAFDGALELSSRLAESETFHGCVASQVFRFASGRVESRRDACTTLDLRERFEASGYDLRELMLAITQTDDFLHRRVGAPPTETP
jgi:hypothetical protein